MADVLPHPPHVQRLGRAAQASPRATMGKSSTNLMRDVDYSGLEAIPASILSTENRNRQRRVHRFAALTLLTCLLFIWFHGQENVIPEEESLATHRCREQHVSAEFDWSKITPSEALVWHSCYDRLECARLAVPLDYSQPNGEKAAVAMTKLPAKVSPTHQSYRGPVLLNPGGPGGSGVDLMLRPDLAESFQSILGHDYDIIGFDPRGVGHTTPVVRVLNEMEVTAWTLHSAQLTTVNSTDGTLGRIYSAAQLLGRIADDRTRHAAEHVSTAVVCRDMLRIVEAHGLSKLQYWGFSYGSVLGATFAAMFPDRVERLIIDGVEDSENYYASLWDNNLRDTDAELQEVYQSCVEAGPSACPLHEKSSDDIDKRVRKLVNQLNMVPLNFYNASSGAYDVISGDDVIQMIFLILYNPYRSGRKMFAALAELETGEASIMAGIYNRAGWNDKLQCKCPDTSAKWAGQGPEVLYAIACGEGDELTDGIPELQKHYERLAEDSTFFSPVWDVRVGCAGWKIRAKERFTGPFVANTSHPILLIGNTADPVTPLWNAHKMSKGFQGSVVLTQHSVGHCSISATSLCTAKYVREYFREGRLPPADTVCEIESSVFNDLSTSTEHLQGLSIEDREIIEASRRLQDHAIVPRFRMF